MYSITFKNTLFNIFRRTESLEWAWDMLRFITNGSSQVGTLCWSLLRMDVDTFKECLRFIVFENAHLAEPIELEKTKG